MEDIKHIQLDIVDSTNSYIREYVLQETANGSDGNSFPRAVLVTAEQQTNGRGRHGKSFYSPAGSGIYLSYAYEKLYSEEDLLQITSRVATLILPVLQAHTDDELFIKPVNDIYKGRPGEPQSRKLVGILVERVDYPNCLAALAKEDSREANYFIIVGIGINCFETLQTNVPEELQDIVGFLEPDCSREQLIEEITAALSKL